MQTPVASFVGQREMIPTGLLRMVRRIEALIDTDQLLLHPERPEHVSEREELVHVLELNRQRQLQFDNLIDRHRRFGKLAVSLSPLSQHEVGFVRGHLPTEYSEYFRLRRRRDLESNLDNTRDDIRDCLDFQANLPLAGLISPNVLISRSFDSVEAVISKNFIRLAGEVHAESRGRKPLYITLALSREALMDEHELIEFLTDITLLDQPPAGFYLLVASRNEDARTDIYNADVIGGWMLVNYTLALNGYSVINGYSDILTPFLGAAGGFAGATGWWSNLRTFSLGRFLPSVGGGRPRPPHRNEQA